MKNWVIKVSSIMVVLFVLIMNQDFIQAQEDGDDIVIGKYRVLHSNVLDEDRLLLIHLPREYGETQLSYPVLYLLYGQDINNYFAEAVIIPEKLGSTGEIPPVIVVGVANTNRYRDNLPVSTRDRRESEFNAMGYRLMGNGKIREAIEVFKLNVELHPDSANAYDSLGEAYMNSGDKKNAVKNYKKSLELNPENNNAKEMLKRLEKK